MNCHNLTNSDLVDYGCNEPSTVITYDNLGSANIVCKLGERTDTPPLIGSVIVDITVSDSFGRTATAFAQFTMNTAHTIHSGSLMVLSLVFMVLWCLF